MNEKERAEKVQEEITVIVAQARTLLEEHVQGVLTAIEEVKRLLVEAQAVAKRYNRERAETLLVSEAYRLEHFMHLPETLRNANIVTGPTTLIPGVKVCLGESLNYEDYRRGSIAVLPKAVVEGLVRRSPPLAFVLEE